MPRVVLGSEFDVLAVAEPVEVGSIESGESDPVSDLVAA